MTFLSSKKKDDFDRVKAWEYQEGWNNPFGDDGETFNDGVNPCDGEDEVLEVGTVRGERTSADIDDDYGVDVVVDQIKDRKHRKKRGKKKKKKRISDEESSQADSLLSEILSEGETEDMEIDRMMTLEEEADDENENEDDGCDDDYDNDSMQVVASTTRENKGYGSSVRYNRFGGPQSAHGTLAVENQLSPRSRYAQRQNKIVDSSDEEEDGDGYNPFDGMNALLKTEKSTNPFGDDSEDEDNGSESSSLVPPQAVAASQKTMVKTKTNTQNPFDDEDEEVDSEDDGNFMNGFSSDEEEEDNEEESNEAKATQESDDEEDIVESSKRLLRMADQRIQYQQHSDEVHDLKATVQDMESKAEAMAEQLRRAVETKCDLVLAQNEMERCHEQDLIAKDDEIMDMRKYIQELLDAQAKSELNFMNEISSLARKLELVDAKHNKEIEEKDAQISELEQKIKSMKTGSVRNNPSREAFKSRFADVENRSVGSNSNTSSKKSLFI
jgi:hypothetical protein